MAFIADASVSLCWFLPDQFTESSASLLLAAQEEGIAVPVHWHLEVINKLGINRRKAKLTEVDLKDALDLLGSLPIEVVPVEMIPTELIALMSRHQLTAYDAAYLQLAMITGLPLATYDKELIAAAPLAGVILLP